MEPVPKFLLDESERVAPGAQSAPDDGRLLDAYSAAVVGAAERVGPAVAHLEVELNGRRGSGSGFAFTPDGLLLTNSHVVHGARHIRATFADGLSHDADLVGEDPDTDIAVIRIGGDALPAVVLGSSRDVRVGQLATAIDTVKWVVLQLLREGRVRRGYLGLAGANQPLARRIARHFELDNTRAVRVESLEKGGPASRAGVEAGDLIVRFAGEPVNGIDDLHRLLTAERIGAESTLTLLRRTQRLELRVSPALRP